MFCVKVERADIVEISYRDMCRSNNESVKVVELPGPVCVEYVKNVVVSVTVSVLLFTCRNQNSQHTAGQHQSHYPKLGLSVSRVFSIWGS